VESLKPFHDPQRGTRFTHVQRAFAKSRMMPFTDKAKEGRVNPKGVPCLYCATDPDTAMAEMRAWNDSYLSVARLRVKDDLRCIDCSKEMDKPEWDWLSPPKER